MSLAGPRASCRGRDIRRTGRGRAEQCFALRVRARDILGAEKHTNSSSQGCKSRSCSKNHQPEPLPLPGASFLCAGGRTLWDTPAPAPMASTPSESKAPTQLGSKLCMEQIKTKVCSPQDHRIYLNTTMSLAVLALVQSRPQGSPPSPVHTQPPTTPGRLRPSSTSALIIPWDP